MTEAIGHSVPIPSLEIRGRERSVRFPIAALLAPMDGVTDPVFRGLVLGLGDAGGAVTEFVRITTGPLSVRSLRREGGEPVPVGPPVGLQLITPRTDHLAETGARAAESGAAWAELSFDCPAQRV